MNDIVDRLLQLALERGALQYGEFTLSSGKKSSYYFDGRRLSLDPEGAYLIGKAVLPILQRAGVAAVGGPTLGADPIVTAIALTSYLEGVGAQLIAPKPIAAFIVRKEAKSHGTEQSIEGPLVSGSRVAIIDDTCTTGASLLHAIAAAEAAGCTVVKVVALLDRREGGSEELRRRGYDFVALMAATAEGKIEVSKGDAMSVTKAYEEVIEFIAAGTSPSSVIAFQPSDVVKQRVADLIYLEKTIGLSSDEKSELDHYMQLEHLMRLAKARARQYIANA